MFWSSPVACRCCQHTAHTCPQSELLLAAMPSFPTFYSMPSQREVSQKQHQRNSSSADKGMLQAQALPLYSVTFSSFLKEKELIFSVPYRTHSTPELPKTCIAGPKDNQVIQWVSAWVLNSTGRNSAVLKYAISAIDSSILVQSSHQCTCTETDNIIRFQLEIQT